MEEYELNLCLISSYISFCDDRDKSSISISIISIIISIIIIIISIIIIILISIVTVAPWTSVYFSSQEFKPQPGHFLSVGFQCHQKLPVHPTALVNTIPTLMICCSSHLVHQCFVFNRHFIPGHYFIPGKII